MRPMTCNAKGRSGLVTEVGLEYMLRLKKSMYRSLQSGAVACPNSGLTRYSFLSTLSRLKGANPTRAGSVVSCSERLVVTGHVTMGAKFLTSKYERRLNISVSEMPFCSASGSI